MIRPDEWGIHVDCKQEADGWLAVVTVPESKTDTRMYYLRAPSQTMLMELVKPFLRSPRS